MSPYLVLMHAILAGLLGQAPADSPERHQQAGCPRTVAWWAVPSNTGGYALYRVGGGCPYPLAADPPSPGEGTWGWDYVGRWFPRNVILGWWHDNHDRGGTYQTDGPNTNHGQATLLLPHD
jgi:hypothetical protein